MSEEQKTEKVTEAQIFNVLETKLLETGKVIGAGELAKIFGPPHQRFMQPVNKFKKALRKFVVLPNGQLRTEDGEIVWVRNTRGSLVIATYRDMVNEGSGHVIDG